MTSSRSANVWLVLGLLLVFVSSICCGPILGLEETLLNISRLDNGDAFFIKGDCGVTRCNEVSAGTAQSSRPPGAGPPCECRCPPPKPLFREDLLQCVSDIPECPLVEFGNGDGSSRVPFVFLPLSGQIIHPSKDIIFQDVDNAICAVAGAQFLTKTGWSNLRNDVDGDVPFSLYRDEGKTYLQWRGTESTRTRVTGRVVLAKLTCRIESRMFAPCVAFRVSGSPPDTTHDISEVWFSHGELSSRTEEEEEQRESSGLESPAGLAIIFSAILALLLYGTLLLLHLRNKNKRPLLLDSESVSFKEDTLPNTKTNPLLSIETFLKDTQGTTFESLASRNDTASISSNASDVSSDMKQSNDYALNEEQNKAYTGLTSATIHHQEQHAAIVLEERCCQVIGIVEKIPELHVAIVEASEPNGYCYDDDDLIISDVNLLPVGPQRKKLYFNPAFFEVENLKCPPPAAIEFLSKIREVIKIAKDKMLAKRFVPVLPAIVEEDFIYSLEQEIKFPYESLSKKHSAVSLRRDSNKKKNYCHGCPGCTDMKFKKTYLKTMSEKEFCKDCVSNEFKQNIVRMWLDEVPFVTADNENTLKQYRKSVAKMEGTPSSIIPDTNKFMKLNYPDKISITVSGESTVKRMSVPPPPPPKNEAKDDEYVIPQELKEKMNAVINELSKFRKIEAIQPRASSPITEVVVPFIPNKIIAVTPKLVIPTPPKYAKYIKPKVISFENKPNKKTNKVPNFEVDSLERHTFKRRASLSNIDYNAMKDIEYEKIHRRRSSIIAMEELEPMKKIYEMNTRLSRSFQEMSIANLAWNDELHNLENVKKLISKDHDFNKKQNLVSEVYISDTNTLSSVSESDSASKLLKIKYTEPLTKPGQLVIEVDGPPNRKKMFEYEDFDPDTLDRKPGKLKIFQESESPPISPNKAIDRIFKKVENEDAAPKLKIGSLLEIFEAKNKNLTPKPEISTYKPKTLLQYFEENVTNEYKPPLPPKKVVGKRSRSSFQTSSNNINKIDSPIQLNSPVTFRVTRSEPNSMAHEWSDLGKSSETKRKFTTFGNMDTPQMNSFHSLDPNYENYCNTDEVDFKYYKSAHKKDENTKRPGRKSIKYRLRRIDSSKVNKTEDSGYLSSDSNESRQKGKFILHVRDKDDIMKEMISDTDEVDSIGDARSESGGESIETNSVFFDSYRRLMLAKDKYDDSDQIGDSGFHGDSLKIDEDNNEYRERFTSFDKL